MTQTAPPTPQPGPQPAPQAAATATPARADQAGQVDTFVDTPALLNRWQLIGMTVAIVFGVLSALVQFLGWQADGRAADDTEQLVRVQEIQSSLLRADALATNAFLVGGLEEPAQRAEYDDAIDAALRGIAVAAEAQPADREALAALNVEVNDYATSVAQARQNNRQGFPVGAQYLSGAGDELRTEALPILRALVDANTERADDSMAGQHPWWLLILGIAALAVLVWLNRELAKAFRRQVNKGLLIAFSIVLAVTVVTVLAAMLRDNSNDDLRDGALADAIAYADARTAANDAKANESLRLIQRGSGEGREEAWEQSAQVVDASLPSASAQWNAYTGVHQQIVTLDREGDWEAAVELATTQDESGSTAPLDAFDTATEELLDAAGNTVTDELRSGRTLALVVSLLTVLLGVVAAVFVARGIGERRKEFS